MRIRTTLLVLCTVSMCGGATGWLAREQDTSSRRAEIAERVLSRGSGDTLVEYFDPACEGSRWTHRALEDQFVRGKFRQVMLPVAIKRWASPTLADALCATPTAVAWLRATIWSHSPPSKPDMEAFDAKQLRACADVVEASTRHLAAVSERRTISTPLVEFRGRVYSGAEAIAELLAMLENP